MNQDWLCQGQMTMGNKLVMKIPCVPLTRIKISFYKSLAS